MRASIGFISGELRPVMRLILLVGLIVITFVFGFLFAHEPFREVVIKKTVQKFFSDDEKPVAKAAPAKEEKKSAPAPARQESRQETAKAAPSPRQHDDLTEKDRRQLDDLLSEKLDQ